MSVKKATNLGFGFNPAESGHYFLVSVPSKTGDVQISEHMSWDNDMWSNKIRAVKENTDERLRVIIPRVKWDGIAAAAASDFNRRLRESGVKRGQWKARGLTPVSRLFGKELVLLAWAVEDADPGRIPVAIANWLGLLPEERWWLFTMTNAATGQALRGKNVGWRTAVRFAICDNPVGTAQTQQRVGLISKLDEDEKDRERGRVRGRGRDRDRLDPDGARQESLFDFSES